jgi:integrase
LDPTLIIKINARQHLYFIYLDSKSPASHHLLRRYSFTGLRFGEVATLKRHNVDLEALRDWEENARGDSPRMCSRTRQDQVLLMDSEENEE